MAAKEIEFIPATTEEELSVAFAAAKRANNAAVKAESMALFHTALAYKGAADLGWFVKDGTKFVEGKAPSDFAAKVGLPAVSNEMVKRYQSFADAYAKGVLPNSDVDRLLRKSGVMSSLADTVKSADTVDAETVKAAILDKASKNKAMNQLAKSVYGEEIALTVPKTNGGNGGDAAVSVKDSLSRLSADAKVITDHMGTLSDAQLKALDKVLDSLAKARGIRRQADAETVKAS